MTHNFISGSAKKILLFLILLLAIVILILWRAKILTSPPDPAPQIFTANPVTSGGTSDEVIPAFAEAQGYGSETHGGRFGRIIFVTNLADTTDINDQNYYGSFRWAVEHRWKDDPADPYDQRRIIIFKVGGTIHLADEIIIKNPYTTIAGQTAPGDGILLRNDQITISTHDVVVRGLRLRVGDNGVPTCCRDGINISTYEAEGDVYNIIIDHNSVSWAVDENVAVYVDPHKPHVIHHVTFQWNIISEGLHDSIHVDEGASVTDPHSMGMILGEGGLNITVHHNLFAHNWGRNPRVGGNINSEIINNLIYAWDDGALEFGGGKSIAQVLNNYFKGNYESRQEPLKLHSQMHPQSAIYLDGNIKATQNNGLIPIKIEGLDDFSFSPDFIFLPTVEIDPVEMVYESVLKNAGAVYPARDEVDSRIIEQVTSGNGRLINSQDHVGGWPELHGGEYLRDDDNDGIPTFWETSRGINPNDASDASTPYVLAPSGYTWIEEYINSLIPLVNP